MRKFDVGDVVQCITTEFEANGNGPHYGIHGTVISTSKHSHYETIYLVRRADMDRDTDGIWYGAEHLELVSANHPMPPPESSLEEIELAQEIFRGVNEV